MIKKILFSSVLMLAILTGSATSAMALGPLKAYFKETDEFIHDKLVKIQFHYDRQALSYAQYAYYYRLFSAIDEKLHSGTGRPAVIRSKAEHHNRLLVKTLCDNGVNGPNCPK